MTHTKGQVGRSERVDEMLEALLSGLAIGFAIGGASAVIYIAGIFLQLWEAV